MPTGKLAVQLDRPDSKVGGRLVRSYCSHENKLGWTLVVAVQHLLRDSTMNILWKGQHSCSAGRVFQFQKRPCKLHSLRIQTRILPVEHLATMQVNRLTVKRRLWQNEGQGRQVTARTCRCRLTSDGGRRLWNCRTWLVCKCSFATPVTTRRWRPVHRPVRIPTCPFVRHLSFREKLYSFCLRL